MIASISAAEIFNYDNFVNKYRVYGSATCNIFSDEKPCPKEMGWQGREITFKFKLDKNRVFQGNMNFGIDVEAVFTEKPITITVNGKKIVSDYVIGERCFDGGNICVVGGRYNFNFSSSLMKKNGKNKIIVTMQDVKVGYGNPTQGFIYDSVSLSDGY